jgi:hypothetical protein
LRINNAPDMLHFVVSPLVPRSQAVFGRRGPHCCLPLPPWNAQSDIILTYAHMRIN